MLYLGIGIFLCFLSLLLTICFLYRKLRNEIHNSVSPHFITVSPTLEQYKEIIFTIYTLKKYIKMLSDENHLENKTRRIDSQVNKLENTLRILGFEILDYHGQKYNDGMNVVIVNTIKSNCEYSRVKECIEPAIVYCGELINKAKIIKEINGVENA